jgi:hypothetical protein
MLGATAIGTVRSPILRDSGDEAGWSSRFDRTHGEIEGQEADHWPDCSQSLGATPPNAKPGRVVVFRLNSRSPATASVWLWRAGFLPGCDPHRLKLPLAVSRIHPDQVETSVGCGGQSGVVGAVRPARWLRVGPGRRDAQRRGGGEGCSPVNGRGEVQVPGVFARCPGCVVDPDPITWLAVDPCQAQHTQRRDGDGGVRDWAYAKARHGCGRRPDGSVFVGLHLEPGRPRGTAVADRLIGSWCSVVVARKLTTEYDPPPSSDLRITQP